MHRDRVQEAFCIEIDRKNAVRQSLGHRFVRACAVETHMDISQEPFCMEIYRRNAGRRFSGQHFVRACPVETHMDISQEPFCMEIYRKNVGRRFSGRHFVRAWAFHKSHFLWKFTGKMPDAYENTSIKHRASRLTVRTPSVWPHCLGN